jgi:hypothetical protein
LNGSEERIYLGRKCENKRKNWDLKERDSDSKAGDFKKFNLV